MTKKKKSNVAKIVAIVLATILVVGATFGLTYHFTNGFEDFKKKAGITDKNGNEMVEGKVYALQDMVMETYQSGEITVQATVKPDDAYDKSLTWALAWKNAESEWATGKTATDYVSMTVQEDTTMVKLSCIEAFGEQIILTATSVANPEATASVTIDYRKKANITGYNFVVGSEKHDISNNDFVWRPKENKLGYLTNEQISFVPIKTLSLGTIEAEINIEVTNFGFTDEHFALIKDNIFNKNQYVNYVANMKMNEFFSGFGFTIPVADESISFSAISNKFYKNKETVTQSNQFTITLNAQGEGVTASEVTYKFSFDVEYFKKYVQHNVSDIEIGGGNIIF